MGNKLVFLGSVSGWGESGVSPKPLYLDTVLMDGLRCEVTFHAQSRSHAAPTSPNGAVLLMLSQRLAHTKRVTDRGGRRGTVGDALLSASPQPK